MWDVGDICLKFNHCFRQCSKHFIRFQTSLLSRSRIWNFDVFFLRKLQKKFQDWIVFFAEVARWRRRDLWNLAIAAFDFPHQVRLEPRHPAEGSQHIKQIMEFCDRKLVPAHPFRWLNGTNVSRCFKGWVNKSNKPTQINLINQKRLWFRLAHNRRALLYF